MKIYMRIATEIEEKIHSSILNEGDKLPSIRQLAKEYNCSNSSVIKALDYLQAQHLIYSVSKSGYYVIQRRFDKNDNNDGIIDFTDASPSWEHFPYSDFQHCLNKAIEIYQRELFQYGTLQGLPSLISESVNLLKDYQIYTSEEQVVVCSGVQQALAILSQIPFPNHNETVLIEEPSYHLFIQTLKAMNIPVVTIKRDPEGIDFIQLEEIFKSKKIKFFYLTPRIHNPLGVSYTNKQKEKIVYLASKYNVYIIEDDYLADFDTNLNATPLHYYDTSHMVIYLKSFSKIMFPGLRIGLAVLPPLIKDSFINFKRLIDIDSSIFSQGALEIYIKSGMFQRHILEVRSIYDMKSKVMLKALKKYGLHQYLDHMQIKGAKTYLNIPSSITMSKLISNLKENKIICESLDKNYYHTCNSQKLRIEFANIEFEQIDDAIRIISEEIIKLQ